MFWLQLATFVLFNLLILAMLVSRVPVPGFSLSAAQHAGGGEGGYTVWHLIADVEAERRAEREPPPIPTFPTRDPDEPTGRHHLRT
ncbi:hypothetical protein [Saccharopolyspora hattusasensis]|uniref:hypothetical protein n=1 Tax=Saccharopolyspora hattusasensis TaxID=1128679 RepID=UPI003D964CB7